MNDVRIWKQEYNGWPNCIWMENEWIRLIVTTDVGPRVICFMHKDGENVFHQFPEQQGLTGGDEWHNFGGHRLWHSPQVGLRPNQPDNDPIEWTIDGNKLFLDVPIEEKTLIRKHIKIEIAADAPRVHLHHRIQNCGMWPIELSPWAMSVMHAGGIEVLPVPREDTYYLPNYAVSFWPWTQPNDPRFTWGEHYFILKHDPANSRWFKIGYRNTEGWGAYFTGNSMFVKVAPEIPGQTYPDYGSTFETYADEYFVELESMGTLSKVEPGKYIGHDETWHLIHGITPPADEADIRQRIEPVIRSLLD